MGCTHFPSIYYYLNCYSKLSMGTFVGIQFLLTKYPLWKRYLVLHTQNVLCCLRHKTVIDICALFWIHYNSNTYLNRYSLCASRLLPYCYTLLDVLTQYKKGAIYHPFQVQTCKTNMLHALLQKISISLILSLFIFIFAPFSTVCTSVSYNSFDRVSLLVHNILGMLMQSKP